MPLPLRHTALSLRPITKRDTDLLFAIYASTRTAEMQRLTHWTEAQKTAFLHMQFAAQHDWYQKNYDGAFFWLIEYNGEPAGRLYLHPEYTPDSMRIIDISLLPAWRNRGLGTGILNDIMAFAEKDGKRVSIHVENFNPAKSLYQKLGFRFVSATNDVYHLMEWKAPQNRIAMNEANPITATVDLQHLSIADFEPYVQKAFPVLFPGRTEEAVLSAVVPLTGYSELERKPFSFVLQTTQVEMYYPQAIYPVMHPSLGALEIFLVPLGVKNGGMQYEAVFS